MTYEEAIKFTKINVEIYCKDCLYQDDCSRIDNCRCTEWEKMVVEALEKQIPKKPKKLTYKPLTDSGWKYGCPCCGLAIGENSFTDYEYIEPIEPYCGQCGQAIDWSDEE